MKLFSQSQTSEQNSSTQKPLSPLSKLIFGALTAIGLAAAFPIVPSLEVFAIGVVVPVLFIASIGLVAEATLELWRGRGQVVEDVQDRVQAWRDRFSAGDLPDDLDTDDLHDGPGYARV